MEDQAKLDNVMRKIKALLETKGCSEAEAAARLAKAQELLERHNLDMATVGQPNNARKDKKREGGLYSWQRKLWQSVAELNFCYYLSIKGLARGAKYEHRVIGSHGNVVSTEVMAQYLQETVERLAQQWARDMGYKSCFVREAIAYREGMTERLTLKLRERREQVVTEARERQTAEQAKARADAAPGTTALTIIDVISTEQDFNNDYLNGWELGTTARDRAKREAQSAANRAMWEEAARKQREWDLAHPEEAAAKAEKLRQENEKWWRDYERRQARRNQTPPRLRRMTPEEERRSMGSFREGYADGAKVGIDRQADDRSKRVSLS